MTSELPDDSQPALTGSVDSTDRPAWLRRTEGEQRWWVAASILVAIGLQTALPSRFTVHPQFLLQGVEFVALVVLVAMHPERMSRRTPAQRLASQILLGLIAITNGVSVGLLVHVITSGGHITAVGLLLGGAEIWFTNTIVFALWYWEYDRGGPAKRALGVVEVPDLLFPQMTDARLDASWEPYFHRLPVRVLHQLDCLFPDGHNALVPMGENALHGAVGDLAGDGRPDRGARGEHPAVRVARTPRSSTRHSPVSPCSGVRSRSTPCRSRPGRRGLVRA